MKKKNLMNVLAVAVTCAMLAGCSQQADTTAPTKAEEETIDAADTEEVAEEPEEVKEASYLLSITAANEDGTYSACDAEKTDYAQTAECSPRPNSSCKKRYVNLIKEIKVNFSSGHVSADQGYHTTKSPCFQGVPGYLEKKISHRLFTAWTKMRMALQGDKKNGERVIFPRWLPQ